jgi:hypothetical protein
MMQLDTNNLSPTPSAQTKNRTKLLYTFLIGAAYGLVMRIIFGLPFFNGNYENANNLDGFASGAMMTSFVIFVPLLIGVLTVFYTKPENRTVWQSILMPSITTSLFVAGTAILLIEGSICIVMALPILIMMSWVGGLVMFALLQWSKPSKTIVHSFLFLPLLTGYFETEIPLPKAAQQSQQSIHIDASPEAIWYLINNATQIKPSEMQQGLAYKMGLPYPIEAITVNTAEGRVRKLRWDKNIQFDEPITAWEENRFVRWNYGFKPGTIPPDALDEHVVIGGKYFDLLDTSYRLTPEAGGTRLDIDVTYRVSTNFNWYAQPWGRVLVDDAAKTILNFYKQRAESKNSK